MIRYYNTVAVAPELAVAVQPESDTQAVALHYFHYFVLYNYSPSVVTLFDVISQYALNSFGSSQNRVMLSA